MHWELPDDALAAFSNCYVSIPYSAFQRKTGDLFPYMPPVEVLKWVVQFFFTSKRLPVTGGNLREDARQQIMFEQWNLCLFHSDSTLDCQKGKHQPLWWAVALTRSRRGSTCLKWSMGNFKALWGSHWFPHHYLASTNRQILSLQGHVWGDCSLVGESSSHRRALNTARILPLRHDCDKSDESAEKSGQQEYLETNSTKTLMSLNHTTVVPVNPTI